MITDASYGTENQCFNLNFTVLTNFESYRCLLVSCPRIQWTIILSVFQKWTKNIAQQGKKENQKQPVREGALKQMRGRKDFPLLPLKDLRACKYFNFFFPIETRFEVRKVQSESTVYQSFTRHHQRRCSGIEICVDSAVQLKL